MIVEPVGWVIKFPFDLCVLALMISRYVCFCDAKYKKISPLVLNNIKPFCNIMITYSNQNITIQQENTIIYGCIFIPDHLSFFLVAFSGAKFPQDCFCKGFPAVAITADCDSICHQHTLNCSSMVLIYLFCNSNNTTLSQTAQKSVN